MKRNREGGVVHWFIIIIGVLIVLTLIGYFTVDKSGKTNGAVTKANQNDCGLVIDKPKENSIVTFPILISGYLKSCDISPITSKYGTVHLIDASGATVSPEVKLPITGNWVGQPAPFYAILTPSKKPQSGSGFLIFINHDKSGAALNTFQVPILFPN